MSLEKSFNLTNLGVYRWEESHMVAEYINWAVGEPNNSGNCIWKTYMKDQPGWHEVLCSHYSYGHGYGEQHALCQVEKLEK